MENSNVEETLEAMIAGTYETPVDEELDTDVNEDTIQEEEDESETETEELDDGQEPEADEEELEDEEDNAQVEEDSEPVEDEVEDVEEEQEPETTETKSTADDIDTEGKPAEEVPENTNEIDYKAFYDQVANAKFKANGKEVEGFKDPRDLIRAQQMLHGYTDKLKVLKEYKKFIKPMQEQGMLENTDKFNLAMSAISGDKEAIKKLVVDNNIDPLDIDTEAVHYENKDFRATDTQISIDNMFEKADEAGVRDRLYNVLENEWDDKSKDVLLNDPAVRTDLVTHLEDGSYDIVMNKIRSIESTDLGGTFAEAPFIEKYRAAASTLQQEYLAKQQQQLAQQKSVESTSMPAENNKVVQPKVDEAKAEVYKKKVSEKKEKEVAEKRNKATSVSKRKSVAKPKKQVAPEELKGDAFKEYFEKMLMS